MEPVTEAEYEERRVKWVAALRSGEFKQGHDRLVTHHNNEELYCCLGVACKVAGIQMENEGESFLYMPRDGVSYYGLTDCHGAYIDKNGTVNSLANNNDVNNFSFERIATIIESKPSGLFK